MFSFVSSLASIIKYKYLILFPALVIEGPIVTLAAGFLASRAGGEVLNVVVVFFVVFLADIVGDTFYYLIGRLGKGRINKISRRLGLTEEKMISIDAFFKKHGTKAIIIGKISHGLGWPAMIGAGTSKMPYPYFLMMNSLVSIGKSAVLVAIGYYYGESYVELSNYISKTGMVVSTIVLIGLLVYFFKLRKKQTSNQVLP